MPILKLIIPKKNTAISNEIIIILYKIEGYNMASKFKGFFIPFSKINHI